MTDQSSIFGSNNSQTPAQNTPASNSGAPQVDNQLETLLAQIKNERGEQKYRTVEDALNGLRHAQEFIPQLTSTLKQKEADLEAANAQAAKISELEKTIASLTSNSNTTPVTSEVKGITPEEIAAIVKNTLTQEETVKTAKQNTAEVVNTLTAKFGDKASEVFYGKAKELGMSQEEMNALAARSPKAAFSLLGIADTSVSSPRDKNSTQSTFNTSGFQPNSESFIGKAKSSTLIGATTQQVREESARARLMVEELHSKGLEIRDLTDPKVYFKHFQ